MSSGILEFDLGLTFTTLSSSRIVIFGGTTTIFLQIVLNK